MYSDQLMQYAFPCSHFTESLQKKLNETEITQTTDKRNLIEMIQKGDTDIEAKLEHRLDQKIESAESKLTNKINAKAVELSNTVSQQQEEIEKMIKDGDNAAKNSLLSTMDSVLERHGKVNLSFSKAFCFFEVAIH